MNARRLLLVLVSALTATAVVAGCSGGGGDAVVSRLLPAEGTRAGGTLVRVQGENFGSGPASVLFDGVSATDVTVLSDNEITCRTPATEMPASQAIKGVDVDVRSSGNTKHIALGFNYINNAEVEPSNSSGINDTFSSSQQIPIDYAANGAAEFTGFIGEQGDVDIYHLHTPEDGRLLINVTWTGSYTSGGIGGIGVEYFHGPAPESAPDAYFGGRITIVGSGDPGDPVPSIADWLRMAYVNDGHGPYIRVQGVGSATHAGYDPLNAYTIRATFVTDPTFEPAPAADSFHTAVALPAENIDVAAAYDQDYDWYTFTPSRQGWTRITLDAGTLGTITTSSEIQLEAKLFRRDPIDTNVLYDVPGADMIVGDRPSVYGGLFEVATLTSATTYMLRVNNFNVQPTGPFTYPLKVERGDGLFEDTEPGQLGAAETPSTARDLGTVAGTVAPTGYSWHAGDDDWFKITTDPGCLCSVSVTWNITNVRAAIGDANDQTNPFGGAWGLMAFDENWFQAPGHVPAPGAALDVDFSQGTNTRQISWAAVAGTNYYIYLDTISGYSLEPGDAYTVSITAN